MKHRILFTIVACLAFARLVCSNTNRLEVYISFNDCINCYVGLGTLNGLGGFEKHLFIKQEDSLISAELLAGYSLENIHYHYSKDLKIKYSYYKFFTGNVLLDSLSLTRLPDKAAQYARFSATGSAASETLQSIYLPPNVALNKKRLDIMIRGSRISFYDYALNKTIVCELDREKDTLKKVVELKGSQFQSSFFLKAGGYDSVLYKNYSAELKKIGKGHVHIEKAYLSDSCIYLMLNFPWVWIDKKPAVPDTVIDIGLFLHQHNFITGARNTSLISEAAIRKKYKEKYGVNNVQPFYIDPKDQQLHTSALDYTDYQKPVPVFLNSSYSGHVFEMQMGTMSIDGNYYRHDTLDRLYILINPQYYYNVKLTLLVDYLQNKIFYLKDLKLSKASWNYDVKEENGLLRFLVCTTDAPEKRHLEVITYDLKARKRISTSAYPLTQDCSMSSLRFYDANTVFYISSTQPKVYLQHID